MRITVLTENTTNDPQLIAEHGLSLYIESNGIRLLFDTGQSDALLHNAAALGIDPAAVDTAVLSHGHYDHGGGLTAFLQCNAKATVYLQRRAFGAYYNAADKYIGLAPELQHAARLQTVGDIHTLNDNMTLFSCNDVQLLYPVEPFGLQKQENAAALCPDDFLHEQYLLITEGKKRILISGCSHKGGCNLAAHFQPDVFIGGLHLSKLDPQTADAARLDAIAAQLLTYPTQYYTCHCTGETQYAYLKKTMGDRLQYLRTGDSLQC